MLLGAVEELVGHQADTLQTRHQLITCVLVLCSTSELEKQIDH